MPFVFCKRVFLLLAPVVYVFAVLVLFQFVAVKIAIGFYERPVALSSLSPDQTRVNVTTEQKFQTGTLTNIGLPLRLKIPSIRVNATIRYVGLALDGAMGVPKLPRDAAWYMYGPRPGEEGNAVIDGHVNWLYGATGVFQNLKDVKVGELITVQDDHGMETSFIVRGSRAYAQFEDATTVFRSDDGKAHLNLITCDGMWDKMTHAYTKRLVVFSDKLEP